MATTHADHLEDTFLRENCPVSIGKAAEECGLSLWEMLDLVKLKGIDWTGYSDEDLERDIAVLNKR